ncbi:unnamed protein product [Symbiodinium sp. CCMP2456]|nr:unnamed protein product [Symbiodinium sp. CCMP2456]
MEEDGEVCRGAERDATGRTRAPPGSRRAQPQPTSRPQTALPRSEARQARASSVTKSCEQFSVRSKKIGAAAWVCTFTGPRFSPTRSRKTWICSQLWTKPRRSSLRGRRRPSLSADAAKSRSTNAGDFWLSRLEAMDLTMLTCISTPKRFVLLEIDDPRVRNLTLPLDILEESVASYAEYTWLKAHRRMDGKGKDLYSAAKNCYFAFRILCFGQQLIQNGRIPDLTAANPKYEVIQSVFDALSVEPGEWDVVEAIFGRLFRAELASFTGKIVAARDGDEAEAEVPEEKPEAVCACALCDGKAPPLRWPEAWRAAALDRLPRCTVSGLRRLRGFQTSTAGACRVRKARWLLEHTVQMANCQHCFHLLCIVKALRSRAWPKKGGGCPLCQRNLRTEVDKPRAFKLWGAATAARPADETAPEA